MTKLDECVAKMDSITKRMDSFDGGIFYVTMKNNSGGVHRARIVAENEEAAKKKALKGRIGTWTVEKVERP